MLHSMTNRGYIPLEQIYHSLAKCIYCSAWKASRTLQPNTRESYTDIAHENFLAGNRELLVDLNNEDEMNAIVTTDLHI